MATKAAIGFHDRNFKLTVIQALYQLGELRALFNEIKRGRKYGSEGPYFKKAKGKAFYGPHPEALARFIELEITQDHLDRVKKLCPDGGDDIYNLIAPNWDGEDDQFFLVGLADVSRLRNLEEIASFHVEVVRDCSPLLECTKLQRIRTGVGVDFDDPKTFEILRGRGVEFPKPAPQVAGVLGAFDPKQPRVLVFELGELRAGFPKLSKFQLTKRLRRRPFYYYDVQFEKRAKLPKEVEFSPAENKQGYKLADAILEALGDKNASHFLFDPSDGVLHLCYGWHANASREELTKAFEASGFEVYSLAFLTEHE